MRLLLLHEHQTAPGLGGGGAESLLRDLSRALKRLGHEVAWWQGQGSIQQALDTFKPDVVQIQTIHNFWPAWLEIARHVQESGIPHVWAIMDYWPICRMRMLLTEGTDGKSCSAVEGVCGGFCQGGRSPAEWLETVNRSPVIAYNGFTAAIYRRNGLRCDYTVELGVDTDLFSPDWRRRDPEPSVYTSAAWPEIPVKGMQIVVEAARRGGHQVNLLAHMTREQVAEGLKRAHVYLFPSIYQETWGLCLNEAMASGCACLASDVAGARAQIESGVTGMLVPPGDARALAQEIEWLVHDPIWRRQFGEAARAHVLAEHSLEAMGRRFEAVYQEVMRDR